MWSVLQNSETIESRPKLRSGILKCGRKTELFLYVTTVMSVALFAIGAMHHALASRYHAIEFEASACPDSTGQAIETVAYGDGRSRISASNADSFCLELRSSTAVIPRFVVYRAAPDQSKRLISLSIGSGTAKNVLLRFEGDATGKQFGHRRVLAVESPIPADMFQLRSDGLRQVRGPAVIGEFAVLENLPDLENIPTSFMAVLLDTNAGTFTLLALSLFAVALGLLKWKDGESVPLWFVVTLAAALALAVAGAALRQKYTDAAHNDFQFTLANNYLQTRNLNESLEIGSRFLQHKGLTSSNEIEPFGIGQVTPYRMPGYPLFVAVAGILFRAPPTDLVSLATSTVYLQVFLLAFALTVFCLGACRIVPMNTLLFVAVAICWFPHSYDMTQNDSIILPCGLLITASLCLYMSKGQNARTIPLRYHLVVHTAFLLYLLVRSDVLLGWAGVSLFMYWRTWRYLLVPLSFFLATGSAWGTYKWLHGGDFVMTTSNVGHVAFVGLWQVPGYKFVWKPTDASYDAWISAHGYHYMEPRANSFAMREVARFWMTYPMFAMSNFSAKLYGYFRHNVWAGTVTLFPSTGAAIVMRTAGYWYLVLVLITAVLAHFEVRRTFLLAWPILLNLPIFCILQHSDGRFVPYVSCSFLISGIPLVLSGDFYRRLTEYRRTTLIVFLVGTTVWCSAHAMGRLVLSDRIRYWNPVLDSINSTLNVLPGPGSPSTPAFRGER
jgi:hypothetical protein